MSDPGPSVLALRQRLATLTEEPAAPASGCDLRLVMQPSGETEWCWAAVSTSVALFYSATSSWTQCAIVNRALRQSTCCTDGCSEECNQPFQLTPALEMVQHLGHDFGDRLTLPAIAVEIDAGRPIGVCIDWTGGGGHFVTIDGYDPNGAMIDVEDPLFGHSQVPLASFPARYQGGGTWAWTYLTRP